MDVRLEIGTDYESSGSVYRGNSIWGLSVRLTPAQAKALRDQLTKHLRGANRDKEKTEDK